MKIFPLGSQRTLNFAMNPGSIVRCRNRDWVLVPSDSEDLHLLRPLIGAMDDVVAINKRLSDLVGYSLPEERVRPAIFPLPSPRTCRTRPARICCGRPRV
jgi:hypothetical protein